MWHILKFSFFNPIMYTPLLSMYIIIVYFKGTPLFKLTAGGYPQHTSLFHSTLVVLWKEPKHKFNSQLNLPFSPL